MNSSTIVLGADHAAFHLKEKLAASLRAKGYRVEDIGCYDEKSVDYPLISQKVALRMQALEEHLGMPVRGLLCCGSGLGVAISANRFPWVRAVVAHDHFAATMSRRHNDANVLCFGARVIAPELAEYLLDVWLNTDFEGAHHQTRVEMMSQLDSKTDTAHTTAQEAASC
jgi:ribose 5-phosphate isomerase B